MVVAVGLPVAQDGRLFNAAAVLQSGKLLGVVPKTYLPGYQEYYEERWFSSAREALLTEVRLAGTSAPFGTDLLFALRGRARRVTLGVEICEDLWAPVPPSSAPRGGGRHRAPEPVRLQRAWWPRRITGGSWCASSRAARSPPTSTPAPGVHESHDRRRLRRPAADRGERGPARGGRALPARRRPDRGRRGHGAAARGAGAPDLVLRRRGSSAAAATGGWRSQPIPSPLPGKLARPRRPPPLRARRIPRPSTSAAARSSPSRPRAWPGASSTPA